MPDTFSMFSVLRKEIEQLRIDIAAQGKVFIAEFEHISTALGDIMRDLDEIKSRLPVRKADKPRRRDVR